MKTLIKILAVTVLLLAGFQARLAAEGTWVALGNLAPGSVGTPILLTDGTVLVQGGGSTTTWYRLFPDNNGHYVNGNWGNAASMNYARQYYASVVLQDGRVFVAGAEYGNGTTNAEIFDPVANNWTIVPVPAGIINTVNTVNAKGVNSGGFVDSGGVLLSNGKVLIAPVAPGTNGNTTIYDPYANTWSIATLVRGNNEDEASWVKLPDDSILTVDFNTQNSERYIPSQNVWVNDTNLPANLYDVFGFECGGAILLPNGKAFYIGSTSVTAIYSPSGNNTPGSWIAGPPIPIGLGAPDAPAAMMNNGKILCALSPTPFSSSNIFTTPTYFYEYDYTAGLVGSFTQIHAPGGGFTNNLVTFNDRMLTLPDGNILYATGGNQLYVYQPDQVPLTQGKPAISSITYNGNGSLHLTGTLFNGISQGASYGDDVQNDSNYPIVKFTDGSGHVSYGFTYNWSSTSVQTGSRVVSTECAMPNNVFSGPGAYTIQVIANGISSDPVGFPGPIWVDFTAPFPGAGTFVSPYSTLALGVSGVAAGGSIFAKGPRVSHETMTINKAMTIVAIGGAVTIGQ